MGKNIASALSDNNSCWFNENKSGDLNIPYSSMYFRGFCRNDEKAQCSLCETVLIGRVATSAGGLPYN